MEEDYVMIPGSGTKKIIRDVKKEIETAFLDYSMSVIVSRALPDVRDGLKPVHRRILYTMHERGNDPSHPYRKSADTVGAVLGSYHPHGDASVYDAMVRLAQDFSLRYPLVDGQGNFGSVDGDPPAAYRYTEARMSRMAVEMLTDIDKDTIDWDPNFDETKKEPSVLPCRFPNLLVNGSQGIAVGMATNIPPHNLSEVIDGCVAYIEDPDIDLPGLMEHIKGPDFPTAGIIMGRSGIRAAYATGRGKITLRGRATIEEKKNGRAQIIVTEIPYMVNKARLIENIADLVKEKRIEGISDLNDETNRKGMRIVVDIRKDANAQVILNQLYQYTQLQDTVGVIMLAIDHKVPKVMTLKQMIQKYVEFQDEVVRRRTQYDLKKARERDHILEGLKKATDIVDELIATIRACKGGMSEAKAAIMEQFGFDDPQADAIVKLQLGRLAGLEILKIEEELGSLNAKIRDWEEILADDARVLEIVKSELLEMKRRFGDDRRTEIETVTGEVDSEDLIAEEQCVYTLTEAGYIKRQLKATYKAQEGGGGGIYGMSGFGLSENLGITRKDAQRYIDDYFEKHQAVKDYLERQVEIGKENFEVKTIMGRIRQIPEFKSRRYMDQQLAARLAMNSPIQGSAADIIKVAMNKVDAELREREMKSKLVLQIHDELIVEAVPEELEQVEELLRRNMENAVELSVPLDCDMHSGKTWFDLK